MSIYSKFKLFSFTLIEGLNDAKIEPDSFNRLKKSIFEFFEYNILLYLISSPIIMISQSSANSFKYELNGFNIWLKVDSLFFLDN